MMLHRALWRTRRMGTQAEETKSGWRGGLGCGTIPCTPCPVARVWGRILPRRVALPMLAAATTPSTPSHHGSWFGE